MIETKAMPILPGRGLRSNSFFSAIVQKGNARKNKLDNGLRDDVVNASIPYHIVNMIHNLSVERESLT